MKSLSDRAKSLLAGLLMLAAALLLVVGQLTGRSDNRAWLDYSWGALCLSAAVWWLASAFRGDPPDRRREETPGQRTLLPKEPPAPCDICCMEPAFFHCKVHDLNLCCYCA